MIMYSFLFRIKKIDFIEYGQGGTLSVYRSAGCPTLFYTIALSFYTTWLQHRYHDDAPLTYPKGFKNIFINIFLNPFGYVSGASSWYLCCSHVV